MIHRVVIVGTGGVGGGIAGQLSASGFPVQLVARGAHLKAIREHGLSFITPTQRTLLRLPVSDNPTWKENDLAILCVKSQDTIEALNIIPPHIPVVCAQNGVENESIVSTSHPTIGMMVWMLAVHLVPGKVVLHCSGSIGVLDVGTISGDPNTSEELSTLLQHAGFDSINRPDIMDWKRSKLVSNLPGILSLVGNRNDSALADALITEGIAVLAKAGHSHIPLDRFLARNEQVKHGRIEGVDRPGGSLWQSQKRGTSSEIAYLNGYIARLGAQLNVATPIHTRLLATLL